ncbi:MAG: DNA/RNA non-specific endonuclease [Pirellulaceae bacterium]|nr:DNA/RNA non-specific endonuclease [Pirellulaceae bacterium]
MRNLDLERAAGARALRQGIAAVIQEMDSSQGRRGQKSTRSRAILGAPPTQTLPQPTADAIENRERSLLQQNNDPALAHLRLERILQGNELTDINYLAQGLSCARSVCRIVLRKQGRLLGYGTGFLVAPGVLITNHHVLSTVELVNEAVAQFRYERTISGAEATPVEFTLETNPGPILNKELDFAIVSVGKSTGGTLDPFGWLYLNPQPGKAFVGEFLTIIQHPNGERKQVCVRENRLLKYDESGPYVWYQTDTVGGSSGSPVFNNSWEVVALHHSGVPRTEVRNGVTVYLTKDGEVWNNTMGNDKLDWIANEGIRISQILKFLETAHANHPLAQKILSATMPPWSESSTANTTAGPSTTSSGLQVSTDGNGITRILVPIEIGVRVPLGDVTGSVANLQLGTPSSSSTNTQPNAVGLVPSGPVSVATQSPTTAPTATELVEIDTTNYDDRNGYNPNFIGTGSLAVPLPTLSAKAKTNLLKINGASGELKYWNYSVVMNRKRRLAFFSAANIDPALGKGNRAGDGWIRDQRVDKVDRSAQIGNEFYEKQKTLEAEDRSKNPFDKGHLTRREDLQWGRTPTLAKRNGDDSFHFPNCAPQHFEFNQVRKVNGIWNRLEQMTTKIAGDGAQFCVFNGPVFDAPVSTRGADGKLRLNLRGKPKTDPLIKGQHIPKLFYKVIVWPEKKQLRLAAFVVSQEDLLAKLDPKQKTRQIAPFEAGLTEDEVQLYQVALADLEHATQLDFGKLAKLPNAIVQESTADFDTSLPVESEHDIRWGEL